jgi:hypothetical protein
MNRITSFLAGAFLGAVALSFAVAAPITGPVDPASFILNLNNYVLKWMSFPAAELGEIQFLGPRAFETATNGVKYLVTVDQAGNVLYILTTSTAPN